MGVGHTPDVLITDSVKLSGPPVSQYGMKVGGYGDMAKKYDTRPKMRL